jgi:alkylation response protein AidB-like acyl-CoA dehydrogenase
VYGNRLGGCDVTDPAAPDRVHGWVRDHLAAFFAGSVNPGAADRDATGTPLPVELFRPAADLDLFGYLLPASCGGAGGDRRTFGLLLEQIGYFCQELEYAALLSMYADVPVVIAAAGSPELVDRYVRPMSRGRCFGTFAYTERTDAFDFGCRVRPTADGYLVDGEKCLQTGGHLADVFLTYVRDDRDDLQLFLVDRGDPGVCVEPVATAGFRSAGLTRLTLRQVSLPRSRLLVGVDGLSHAQRFLNQRRLFVACPMVGRMKAIIESCVTHLGGVVRQGVPLTRHEAVQAKLGRMLIRYEAARAVLHDALARWAAGAHNPLFDPVVSAAKYTIVENALAVGMDAVQLTGWLGYSRELPYERYLRGFMAGIAGQTAQDVLEILLGNEVVARSELVRYLEGVAT